MTEGVNIAESCGRMITSARPGFDREPYHVVVSEALSGPGRVDNDLGTRRGLFMPRIYERAPAEERFWPKVQKTETCWLWIGAKSNGYGSFRFERGEHAHRFSYELLVGPIPDGMQLDHLCRVRNCVNPAHLEPVTLRENILRGIGLTAANARKTHCPQGHAYDAENTYVYRGSR